MQFLFPVLSWAFLLVLVPLVIHLINLMRQQRVEWAAMEFLLKSYRKHRRWIWLKQFLLLLLRMVVVAAVVAMLAGLMTRDRASFLAGQSTHHFILLDDSLSMGDRSEEGTAFDRALQSLSEIARTLAEEPSDQRVTLIRFSATERMESGLSTELATMNAVVVDSEFAETMETHKRGLQLTELALEPGPALEVLKRLVGNAVEQRKVAYVLSDYRRDHWEKAAELKESLRGLRELGADVHLIRCVQEQHQNLAVRSVAPEAGTLAAGVPLLVNVEVSNPGPQDAQQVTVRLATKSYPRDVFVRDDSLVPEEQLTSLVIEEVPAGETVMRQAQLKFDRAGEHVVEAHLASDALLADNVRRALIDIPLAVPVLLVDGSPQGEEAYYLESIFAPGRVVTGIQSVTRSVNYLRDVVDAELAQYAAVYLLNVERLDPRAVSALERYVSGGGGLAVFTGPNCDPAFLMELYRDGEGLMPVAVQPARDHVRVAGDPTPDLHVHDHPVFRVLVDEGGKNRPLTQRIRIDRYFPPDPEWSASDHPQVSVLTTVRGEDPLVVERAFGAGRVVAFLTTASPSWNNWAMGPSYPVVVLQLHGYLSSAQQAFQAAETGGRVTFQLDTTEFLPEVRMRLPAEVTAVEREVASAVELSGQAAGPDSPLVNFELGPSREAMTNRSGLYVADLETLERQPRQRRFVVNVPTRDSDLALVAQGPLAETFEDIGVEVHSVTDVDFGGNEQDGSSWSQLLAGLLVALLLGEQLLALSASYHPKGEGQS